MILSRKCFIILVIALLLAIPSLPYQAKAQVTIEKISSFNHQMFVNDYGFILVNETIFVKNDLGSSATLPSINITYPSELYNKIILQLISPKDFSFNIALTENYTKLTIDPKGYEIQPNENFTISVKFYLVKMFSPVESLNYSASIPLVPALSLPIEQVNSSLSIPTFTVFVSQHENFTAKEPEPYKYVLEGSFSNATQGFSITENVKISIFEDIYFALLEFTEAKRELILSPLGDIRVRDTITMINYDNKSISKLKEPSLLTNDFSSIVIIPPLTNPSSNPLGNALNKTVDLGTSLEKGERYTVTLEYPIKSSDFIKAKDGLFELSLPLKSPIDGVVYDYTVKINPPEGFFAYGKTEESKENASPLLYSEQKIEFRFGLAWASKDIMPIASFIFIATLVAFIIVGKPFIKEELREIIIRAREYIESSEEKITATKELIDLCKKRQSDQISKREFKTTRQLLEERRSKATIKINELRPKLISLQPSLQKPLSDISDLHRDYDRAVKELINLYEQLFTKKVKVEAFDRLLPSHQRRVDEAMENLLNGIDRLRREVE